MLSSSDWQLVCSVVVDDLGDGGEGRAVFSEHVSPLCRLSELHMHEALTTPDRERGKCSSLFRFKSRLLQHIQKKAEHASGNR